MSELEIKMPDLSTTSDSVTLVSWLIKAGDTIKLGQPIAEIETDKATMELEAAVSGKVTKILIQAGEKAAVGAVVAIAESQDKVILSKEQKSVPSAAPKTTEFNIHKPTDTKGKSGSLFARNKLNRVKTGEILNINPTQMVVAKRLVESKQNIPHYYLTGSVNAAAMIKFRENAKPEKIVWDAFFVSAVANAVLKYEKFTYRFKGDKFEKSSLDSVGVAVDMDDELFVISVEDASKKDIRQISAEILAKVEKLKAGGPSAKKLSPANITITNLGSANVRHFSAIVNPPESAILAIGKIAEVPVVKDGQLAIGSMADITLSVDHRIINGKYAANFLSQVIHNLETNLK